MEVFQVTTPTQNKVPIIISSPHSGTFFPEEVKQQLVPEYVENPDDTDWCIDRLYDFAPTMGITLITANYNRWVIDLNRDPNSQPLYNDGRVITGLVPTTNFNGEMLYRDETPSEAEIQRRLKNYYLPYHKKLEQLLHETRAQFGTALLFDAHSIRKVVPGIQKEAFPDLILGDNDQTSASEAIIETAFSALKRSDYHLTHNHPFKGGHITRSFGNPKNNIHALQLEMAKTNYMDDSETEYHEESATKIRQVLQLMFQDLISLLA
ncbi:MAG: N-formylglutamate deformylase [Alteromonas sp.]|nr:N-formylglutamate deformylase [Alteromonas sp.]MAY21951.1 N-formylglutamate deformylase [Flavobacteriaceae bacterium]|tara:strand:+ start:16802 stop:17596 length:795 start_codon:yes stop_codon:yes gene_type:complete